MSKDSIAHKNQLTSQQLLHDKYVLKLHAWGVSDEYDCGMTTIHRWLKQKPKQDVMDFKENHGIT